MNPGAIGVDAAFDAQKQLVGQTAGTSGWVCVDQEMIDLFAESTDDFQYIHVDPEKAKALFPIFRHHRTRLPDPVAGESLVP